MELLPIIYFSLAIFAVLSVVTIIFSYISYKVRQSRAGESEEPDQGDQILDDKKFIGDKPTKYQTKVSYIHSKERTTKVYKQSHRKKHSGHNTPKKEEPKQPLKRIEVLNNLEREKTNPKPTVTPKKEFRKAEVVDKKEKLNSLGDNILDKYADDLKDDLYILDSDKKNKKTKEN
ncbi:MAG: hypothetical protein PVH88_21020 [Ignavibacteria bacterium]|jgi:hypothetical protein